MFVNTPTGLANSPDEPPDDCGSSGIYFPAHGLVVIFTFLYHGGWGVHVNVQIPLLWRLSLYRQAPLAEFGEFPRMRISLILRFTPPVLGGGLWGSLQVN